MLSLNISQGALATIRTELAHTEHENPIIALVQSSQSFRAQDEIADLVTSKEDSSDVRRKIVGLLRDDFATIRWRLLPAAYPREEAPPDSLVEISGICFSFPPEMHRLIDGGSLDTGELGLVLKDAAGTVFLPQPLELAGIPDGT